MQIENHFEIPLPPGEAWPVLMNVPATAACFPGASLIEQVAEGHYKGHVTVKLGPLAMVFAGNLHVEDRDDAAYKAAVKAQWSETRGRGRADTVSRFALAAHGSGTRVTMLSDLQLAGQVAQYGRGVGMISAISSQLIAAFADNLGRRIQTAGDSPAPSPSQTTTEISGLTLIAKALGNRITG